MLIWKIKTYEQVSIVKDKCFELYDKVFGKYMYSFKQGNSQKSVAKDMAVKAYNYSHESEYRTNEMQNIVTCINKPIQSTSFSILHSVRRGALFGPT
jgi:hypothetical protein